MVQSANTSLVVSDLNFVGIKTNLQKFLQQQQEFKDYNFAGSTINQILSILAYNTYYMGVYENMVSNECFLDTATLRDSVVSNAKAVGYVPRSAKAAEAEVLIFVLPIDAPDEIIVPKYTRFQSQLDGVKYTWTTDEDVTIVNTNGTYNKILKILEGEVLTYTFTYDGSTNSFELPNPNTDTDSLVVKVKANADTTDVITFTQVEDITHLSGDSNVYFIQENSAGNYEVYFGDGVLGKSLQIGNVVSITCRVCSGTIVNDVNSFTPAGYIGYNKVLPTTYYQASAIRTFTVAANGQEKEDIESIRFNAPKYYDRQNRLVVADDYRSYVLANFGNLAAVNAWGGEKNVPPIYGKVFLSIKPDAGYSLNNVQKDAILNDLVSKNTLSIDPIIIDPVFTFINLTINVNYNPDLTSLSPDGLYSNISSAVASYESNNLGLFEQAFYRSKFNTVIDNVDNSFVSSDVSFLLEKRFAPVTYSILSYEISFSESLYHPYDGFLGCMSSEGFTVVGNPNVCYFDDDGFGKVRMYYFTSTNSKFYVNSNIGTINYATGIIQINSIAFAGVQNTTLNELRIFVTPGLSSYTPTNNEIVLFSYPKVQITDVKLNAVTKAGTPTVQGNISPLMTTGILNTVVI
jgi:hypothetical protein